MRELYATTYDSRGYSDENMLLNYGLIEPAVLSRNLTYLWGKDSDMFPLTTLSEGQGAFKSLKPITLNDTQYTWNTMGRMKHTSRVVSLVVSNEDEPGLGRTPIEVIMEDNWFIKSYTAFSPDGKSQVRIQSEGTKVGANRYKYIFELQGGNEDDFIDPDNFTEGKAWVMGAPTIAASKSDGSRSNSMAPGKLTNQFGLHRYSKEITGNIANKITVIEFDLEDGSKTNMWMPFEMKLFELDRRLYNESDLWLSEYNRDDRGVIHLKDPDTGEPIPRGAGVFQTLKSFGHYDTYSKLTYGKLNNTVNAVFDNRVDSTPTEIVLHTGKGGAREFHNAIMSDATARQYFTPLGEKEISGGIYLTYGAYFNQYRTIDNKLITVKTSNYFDHGLMAEAQRANGDMIDGLPRDSYTMVFLDQSRTDDGDRNIQLVAEEGREHITGIYKGITPLPGSWGAVSDKLISTRRDVASYEVIDTAGIAFKNPTTSFLLERQ